MFESLEREHSSDSMIHRRRHSVAPWTPDSPCFLIRKSIVGKATDSIKSDTKLKKHERRYRLKSDIKVG
jgi:hypothetical protein